jgi:predicted amidophosphoribosyltransferase
MTGPERVERKGMGGRIFSVSWRCPNCLGKADKNDRFCRNCGMDMLSSVPPPSGLTGTERGRRRAD